MLTLTACFCCVPGAHQHALRSLPPARSDARGQAEQALRKQRRCGVVACALLMNYAGCVITHSLLILLFLFFLVRFSFWSFFEGRSAFFHVARSLGYAFAVFSFDFFYASSDSPFVHCKVFPTHHCHTSCVSICPRPPTAGTGYNEFKGGGANSHKNQNRKKKKGRR